ncbi:MAG: hypothetical protein N0C86_21200, partial [Candidatus Thiodiazotropha taylori]|nr:hypothetical protein [Candidatus Thiodiazotropha taylori]MCW4328516.1 hypothetical protein [Candidatus Thiodiazotropha taylori]
MRPKNQTKRLVDALYPPDALKILRPMPVRPCCVCPSSIQSSFLNSMRFAVDESIELKRRST